jgi:hypothetical protein
MKTRILILLCLVFVQPILSQNIRSRDIDSVTTLALKEFNVPGMAVAVVKDGKVIHAKGYGVRSIRNNQQSGPSMRAVTGFILDRYLGVQGIDRIKEYSLAEQRSFKYAKNVTDSIWKDIESALKTSPLKIDNKIYTGIYKDNWFGNVSISEKNGKLWFASEKSPKLSGGMIHYRANTFIVKWTDRSLDADAFVLFNLDKNGKAAEFSMSAISPLTDFSFDFQDLEFISQ